MTRVQIGIFNNIVKYQDKIFIIEENVSDNNNSHDGGMKEKI